MKCKYSIQINQHLLSLYLVIFKNAVLTVLFFHSYHPKGVYTPDSPLFVLKFAFNHLETLL